MKIICLAAVCATAMAIPAHAQDTKKFDGPWVGATVGFDRMGSRGGAADGSKGGASYGIAAGYDFRIGKMVAGIEVERGGNTIDATAHNVAADGDELKLSVGRDRYAGVRLGVPVNDNVLLYAKGGYTKLHARSRYVLADEVTKDSSDHEGWRVGAGAEVTLGKPFMRLEYRFSGYKKFEDEILKSHRHQLMFTAGVRF